jgi:hypothetical protein
MRCEGSSYLISFFKFSKRVNQDLYLMNLTYRIKGDVLIKKWFRGFQEFIFSRFRMR